MEANGAEEQADGHDGDGPEEDAAAANAVDEEEGDAGHYEIRYGDREGG